MTIKEHPKHNGYFISTEGEVFSFWKLGDHRTFYIDYDQKSPRKMSQRISRSYYVVTIRSVPYYVHKLVAETFLPNPNDYPQVNHIDENKLNNHLSNLEWCTAEQNMQHSFAKEYIIEEVSTGNTFKIKGFKKFCRENNLNERVFRMTYHGMRNQHKGYKMLEIIDKNKSKLDFP